MSWVKVFAIKIDPLSTYSWSKGQKYMDSLYHLPVVADHIQLDGEDFVLDSYLKQLNRAVSRNIVGNIRNIVKKLNQVIIDFEKFCRQNKSGDSPSDLLKAYQKFHERYSYFLGVCDAPVFADKTVSDEIYRQIKSRRTGQDDQCFRILTTFLNDTYSLKEEKELLRLAARLKQLPTNLKSFQKNHLYPKLVAHHRRYTWLGLTLVLGKALPLSYFFKRLKAEYREAQTKLKEIQARQRKNRQAWQKTARALRLDKNLLRSAQLLMWIRDKRFMGLTRGCFYQKDLFTKIAVHLNLEANQIFYLLPNEIEAVLLGKKKLDKKLIATRQKGYALVTRRGCIGPILTGSALKKLRREMSARFRSDTLKGVVTSPGCAQGKVKIILDSGDFGKFQTDDILIANMTTPDYVPIMKKAAAIITDIGGITCHAAIMSRELGIPCIIGAKIATKVLRDGQLVEVDANKGLIRLLGRTALVLPQKGRNRE